MQIARTIGLMSWEDTSALRKTISKSLGEEVFNTFWVKFFSDHFLSIAEQTCGKQQFCTWKSLRLNHMV